MKKLTLTMISAFGLLIQIGCANPQTPNSSYTGLSSVNSQALANCNTFSVSSIVGGNVEHPLSGANRESFLYVYFNNVSSNFLSNPSNQIIFNRLAVSSAGSSEDPTPLTFTVGSSSANSLTPAMAQSISPLVILLSGTDVTYNVIQISISINGGTAASSFLIPEFQADPMAYQADPSHTQGLLQLHPFYNYLGQSLDFVSMSNAFCFL